MTRRALLVGGRSVAPNSFVLGIDPDRDVMVIHQLVVNQGEAERVNGFVIAAIAMLAAVLPCGIVVVRGSRHGRRWWPTRRSARSS